MTVVQWAVVMTRVLKDELSSLFLAFVFAALQDAAMSRTDLPPAQRIPFTVYADEYVVSRLTPT